MYHITGPVLIAVATPPLAIYLALKLYPNRFDEVDQSSRKLALIGGLFAMTEGAIQVSYRRPLRVIPIVVLGSLIGSLFAGWFGLENILLVGGILGVFSVNNVWIYLAAHLLGVGVIVGLLALTIPKKTVVRIDGTCIMDIGNDVLP